MVKGEGMKEIISDINSGFLPVRVPCRRCAATGIEPHTNSACSHCHGRKCLMVLRWVDAGVDEGDELVEMSLEELWRLEGYEQAEEGEK